MEFRYKGTKNISDYQLFLRLSYPELAYYMLHRKDPPYTIEELKDILFEVESAKVKPTVLNRKQRQKAASVRFQSDATMLKDVNLDGDVRRLIHNMMEMDGGTMMKNITSVCMGLFGERYASMQPKDWSHLIDEYVRKVTNRSDLKEDTLFYYKAV